MFPGPQAAHLTMISFVSSGSSKGLMQKVKSRLPRGDGGAGPLRPLKTWLRRQSALLVRLRPLLPFLLIFVLSLMAGVRRSRTIARPIELGYAA